MSSQSDNPTRVERPIMHREGSTYIVEWVEGRVKAVCRNVREHSDALTSEVTWYASDGERWNTLFRSMFNMQAPQTRNTLSKILSERARFAFNWSAAIDQLAILVPDAWRAGEPFLLLAEVETETTPRFLIDRILPENDVVVLYGNGEAGKSLVSMGMALAVATGQDFAGRYKVSNPGPVLYLDWETHKDDQARRFRRMAKDLVPPPGFDTIPLHYRRMTGGLADQIEILAEFVDKHGIRFVVGDSLGFAVGEEPNEAGGAIRVMDAARSLQTSFLFTAHITKQETKQGGRGKSASIFGSKFFELSARATWEVRGGQNELDDTKNILLFNRKANNVKRQEPLGLRVDFEPGYGAIRISDVNIADNPTGPASIGHRMTKILATRGAMTIAALAEATGATEDSVRRTLQRMADRGDVRVIPDTRPARWGLSAPEFAGSQRSMTDLPIDPTGTGEEPTAGTHDATGAVASATAVATAQDDEGCQMCGSLDGLRYTAHGMPVCAEHAKAYEDD